MSLRTALWCACAASMFATGCSVQSDSAGPATAPATDAAAESVAALEPESLAATPLPSPTPEPPAAPGPTATPAPTAVAPDPTVPPPTVAPDPTVPPVPDDGCAVGERAQLDPDRPRYELDLAIDLAQRTVVGNQQVRFTPDLAIDELVLRLWPNGPRPSQAGNSLTIDALQVDDTTISPFIESPTLARVPLLETVEAGDSIDLVIEFTFRIGAPNRGRMAATSEWARFGSFYPMVAWEPGRGWATESPTSGFAEAVSSVAADFSVALTGIDDRDVLAVGSLSDDGRWESTGARDFAVSIGTFEVIEATALAPAPVVVRVGRHSSVPDDPHIYLDRIVASLESFADRWGAYPWPELSVALTPELRGGIEFPGHVMQGPGSFGRTTPHEVAHQWFYALVGNNQGRDPWLDEGLASYAEFGFEGVDPADLNVPAWVADRAGEPMDFWETQFNNYYPGVYINPAKALDAAGDPETIDCVLRRYVAANAFKIATPADFFAAADGIIDDPDTALAPFGLSR